MSVGEEKAKRKGWQFSLRSLFLLAVVVGLASGWLLTAARYRKEVRILQSQLDSERDRAVRLYESVYMTSDEETKSQLRDAWEKALR
jgi:gas vesicle protein